ncbi:MAG TPA: D-alanyl-D-alanine carboxypeptidase family protein [Alphaproteobacteria bacterium]
MKRLVAVALFSLIAVVPIARAAQYAAIVIDAKTGEVLHAIEPDAQSYPASLTKMMTLYLLFEALNSGKVKFDEMMPVSAHAASQSPSKLGLAEGTYLTVEEGIGALVTKSANDAAAVIAEFLGGGSEDAFARKMTAKARRLGMNDTVFRNASGLPDPEQISTVRDMATLSRALQRDFPQHYHYFSMTAFDFRGRSIHNHNRLLYLGKGYDGLKTGYTHGSGFNLAASAERDGRRLIGVVFGGQSAAWRDSRMARIVDVAYAGGSDAPSTMVASRKSKSQTATQLAAAKTKKKSHTQLVSAKRSFSLVAKAEAGTLDQPAAKAAAKAVQNQAVGYAVQVGAFGRQDMAQAAAQKAKQVNGDLAEAKISVARQGQGSDSLYVARLTGMSQQAAKASCTALKKKKIDCIVVSHDPA